MGVNFPEYNFTAAVKPCGLPPICVKPSGRCIKNAKENCSWFSVCDLKEKRPPEKPTLPKKYRRPKRQSFAAVLLPGSKFLGKQKALKKKIEN